MTTQAFYRFMCAAAAHEELRALHVPAGFGITADDCDGSHYEREAQDAIVSANIRALIGNTVDSRITPWGEG